MEKNIENIDFESLSQNPSAVCILDKNIEKIYWCRLSMNPSAISILEKHMDKIEWCLLSMNPCAMHLLKKNIEKINWSVLSINPSIFNKKMNYKCLYQKMNVIREELMMKCMHPSRLERFLEMGGDIDDF